jgi:hypothetical protein
MDIWCTSGLHRVRSEPSITRRGLDADQWCVRLSMRSPTVYGKKICGEVASANFFSVDSRTPHCWQTHHWSASRPPRVIERSLRTLYNPLVYNMSIILRCSSLQPRVERFYSRCYSKSTNFVFLVPKILKNCYCELKLYTIPIEKNQYKITSVQGNIGRFKATIKTTFHKWKIFLLQNTRPLVISYHVAQPHFTGYVYTRSYCLVLIYTN